MNKDEIKPSEKYLDLGILMSLNSPHVGHNIVIEYDGASFLGVCKDCKQLLNAKMDIVDNLQINMEKKYKISGDKPKGSGRFVS